MSTPAGNYKLYTYQALSTTDVDQIDSFSGFPENIKLSKLIDRSRATGQIGSAKLVLSAQPVTSNYISIGSNTYEFLDTGEATSPFMTHGSVTITSANLATDFNIELPFAPSDVYWEAYDSSFVKKVTTAILTVTGNSILVNANAGATALIAGDIIKWQAIGF